MSDCPSGFIQRRYCVYAIKVNYSSKTEFEFEGKKKKIQIKKRNKKSQPYTFVKMYENTPKTDCSGKNYVTVLC